MRCTIPLVLLALLLPLGPGMALAQEPTVRFATSAMTVNEDVGTFDVGLILDGTPTGSVGVIVEAWGGSAGIAGDFGIFHQFVSWDPGDPATQSITLSVVDDAFVEPDEVFSVTIMSGDGASPGDPSTLTVTIRDTTPAPPVEFVLPEFYPGGGVQEYFTLAGGNHWNGQLRLASVPAAPVTVQVQVSGELTPRDVVFDGVQVMPFQISSPPVGNHGFIELRNASIVSGPSPAKKSAQTVWITWFFESEVRPTVDDCFFCIWDFFFVLTGKVNCNAECITALNYDCGALPKATEPARAEADFMPLLRRYRDEVLTSTNGGTYYANLYSQLSSAATLTLLDDPSIIIDIWDARVQWLPAIQALVDGNGGSTWVSLAMRNSLLSILDKFEAAASPALAQQIAAERTRIGLDTIAGLTLDQFQQRVVNAGASVGIEDSSWGSVKARFGQ